MWLLFNAFTARTQHQNWPLFPCNGCSSMIIQNYGLPLNNQLKNISVHKNVLLFPGNRRQSSTSRELHLIFSKNRKKIISNKPLRWSLFSGVAEYCIWCFFSDRVVVALKPFYRNLLKATYMDHFYALTA